MDSDTRSGTMLFYQVKPSGRRKVLKMVPGKSIQTQTVITSSVQVLSTLVTQSRASPSRASMPPLTPPPLSQGHSKAQVQPLGLSCSSTCPVEPVQSMISGTCLVKVPAPVQPRAKTRSKRMVLVIPSDKSDNSQIITNIPAERNVVPNLSPAQPHVSLHPPTAPLSESNAIRTFTRVTNTAAPKPALKSQPRKLILRFPQRPNSPNKWVVEENGVNSLSSSQASLISPAITSEVLEVVAKHEQSNKSCVVVTQAPNETETQPECSVVMWNEKMFFRVEKKEPKTGAAGLIDLCDEDVCEAGKAADTRGNVEDSVSLLGCIAAQTGSRAKDGAKEKSHAVPGGHSSSTQPVSSREGPTPRARGTQTSSAPAPCPVADRKLKQMFGITSEVEIRLPRIVRLHAGRSSASQGPPLDYTEPIEEDFLCDADPPHSQDCPQVEATSSRVGRTRKRTKCPCCSPAALLRHHAHKRRSKPGERRDTARKQLRLSTVLIAPKTDSLTIAMPTRKLVKLMPAPPTSPFTATLTTSLPTSLPAPLTAPTTTTTPETTTNTIPMTTTVTPQKQVQPLPAALTTSLTLPLTTPLTTPLTNPLTTPLTNPLTLPLTTPLTTPLNLHTTRPDVDCEELQIHREIQLLRNALRLKEAALEKLKSHKST